MSIIFEALTLFNVFTQIFANESSELTEICPANESERHIHDCYLPPFPPNGHFSMLGAEFTPPFGSRVPELTIIGYTCNPGYEAFAKSTAVCQHGKWETKFIQCLKKSNCILPVFPEHGFYELRGSSSLIIFGEKVPSWTLLIFSCEPLYDIIGGNFTVCQDGEWTSAVPICERNKRCTIPPSAKNTIYNIYPPNSNVHYTNVVEEMTAVITFCDPGYYLVGGGVAVCIKGNWFSGISSCKELNDCVLPNYPENGDYYLVGSKEVPVPGKEVQEKESLNVTCFPDYQLFGYSIITCFNGSWTAPMPNCTEKTTCLLPEAPLNGLYKVIGDHYDVEVPDNTILTMHCDFGYKLVGANFIYCQKRIWSNSLPHCTKMAVCNLPAFPLNGSYDIIGKEETSVAYKQALEDTVLAYSCDDHFNLIGPRYIHCEDGRWSNNPPRCKENQCTLPFYPRNGQYEILNFGKNKKKGEMVRESTVLTFSCNSPYYLQGISTLFCGHNGWSSQIPECRTVNDCPNVPSKVSGVYVIQPGGYPTPFPVYCEMNLNSSTWTVILSRFDGSVDFYRNYQNYTDGFGSADEEYWLGLERIHQITKDNKHELYIELEAFNGSTAWARYESFKVDDKESGYKLNVAWYTGTAGDALGLHNGMKFTTFDMDQDMHNSINCADRWKGGWWYQACHSSHLTGLYHSAAVEDGRSMMWYYMFDNKRSLKKARMLTRRRLQL